MRASQRLRAEHGATGVEYGVLLAILVIAVTVLVSFTVHR
jgi:Flp pilus assembly pilin Flp